MNDKEIFYTKYTFLRRTAKLGLLRLKNIRNNWMQSANKCPMIARYDRS